jgi:hypothetical protein
MKPLATRIPPRPIDAVWTVLTAANDIGDEAMVTVCRRVIDARLRGDQPRAADIESIENFWSDRE